jgi:hypothetical protein
MWLIQQKTGEHIDKALECWVIVESIVYIHP